VDCSRVSHLLSDYVDDQLHPESKKHVEEHLASCQRCTAELVSLQAYLRMMAATQRISAPQSFLDAVHERIDQVSTLERITRWLFHPLRVKLPMELAGIALAGLLLVFAYQQSLRPEKENVHPALSGETRQSVASREMKEASADQAAKTEPEKPVSLSKTIRIALLLPRSSMIGDAGELETPMLPSLDGRGWGRVETGDVRHPHPTSPVEGEGLSSPALSMMGDAADRAHLFEAPASAPAKPQQPRHKALQQAAPRPFPSQESVPSVSTGHGTREESSAPHLSGQLLGLVKESAYTLGGAVLSVEYDKGANDPKTIVVRIPAANYAMFLGKLGRAGQLKETGKEPVEVKGTTEGNEWIEIRIDLIQSD